MERITSAQLNSALQPTSQPSEKRLSVADSAHLMVLVGQMLQRYPSQDLTDSVEGLTRDYEALALKYSLPKVEKALASLRIKPGQAFFPRPDEVADEIENLRERGVNDAIRKDGQQFMEYWDGVRAKLNTPEEKAWRKEQGYE